MSDENQANQKFIVPLNFLRFANGPPLVTDATPPRTDAPPLVMGITEGAIRGGDGKPPTS